MMTKIRRALRALDEYTLFAFNPQFPTHKR